MNNERRRLWFTLLFISLFAPFLALLAMSVLFPISEDVRRQALASPVRLAGAGGLSLGGTPPPPARANVPVLAGGDGRQVWVVHPLMDGTRPGFQLYTRAANARSWRLATLRGVTTFQPEIGLPRAMMVDEAAGGLPVIIGDNGFVQEYSATESVPLPVLPPGHTVKAALGGESQLFVVTFGLPLDATTRPFDPLPKSFRDVGTGVTPEPARAETAPGSTTTTAPATTAATSQPATASGPALPVATSPTAPSPELPGATGPQRLFNVYWFPPRSIAASTTASRPATAPTASPTPGSWCLLPPLGDPVNHATVPPENAQVVLAERAGILTAFWIDTASRELVARSLAYADAGNAGTEWSAPVRSPLPEEINGTRLLPVMLDKSFYLFWPVPTGASVDLHGGWIDLRPGDSAYKLTRANMLPAMPLGDAAKGVSVTDDIAVAPAENSLLVTVLKTDNTFASLLFDSHGMKLSGPDPLTVRSLQREMQIGQNIVMVLMALMVVLSLWSWRQKQLPPALPQGIALAPIHLRAGALFIDLAAPYAVVVLFWGGFEGGPLSLLYDWLGVMARPEEFARTTGLLPFLVLFFAHMLIGELATQKTLGKWMMGLSVSDFAGKPAKPGAIIVRNLIRIPEMLLLLGPLYVALSDRRQRLGDLVAGTLVVGAAPPQEEPQKKKRPGE